MKNNFEVRNGIVYIEAPHSRNTSKIILIDEEDLERADIALGHWRVLESDSHTYYAKTYIKDRLALLHRFLLNPPTELVVDHINRNPLDNRRCNLRICTRAQNSENRSPLPSGSGIRNVHFDKNTGLWRVQLRLHGEVMRFGSFESIQEAEYTAKAARAHYMPFSEEALEKDKYTRPNIVTYKTGKSGVRGVHWVADSNKWQVRFMDGDKAVSYGYYTNKEDAENVAIRILSGEKLHPCKPPVRNSKSGATGVHWMNHKEKWVVEFKVNGKRKSYGRFEDLEDAKKRAEEVQAALRRKK